MAPVAAIVADKTGTLKRRSAANERMQSRRHESAYVSLGRGVFHSYPNPALSPLAARHVKPASSRLGFESVGCEAWLVPHRPTVLAPTKNALPSPPQGPA